MRIDEIQPQAKEIVIVQRNGHPDFLAEYRPATPSSPPSWRMRFPQPIHAATAVYITTEPTDQWFIGYNHGPVKMDFPHQIKLKRSLNQMCRVIDKTDTTFDAVLTLRNGNYYWVHSVTGQIAAIESEDVWTPHRELALQGHFKSRWSPDVKTPKPDTMEFLLQSQRKFQRQFQREMEAILDPKLDPRVEEPQNGKYYSVVRSYPNRCPMMFGARFEWEQSTTLLGVPLNPFGVWVRESGETLTRRPGDVFKETPDPHSPPSKQNEIGGAAEGKVEHFETSPMPPAPCSSQDGQVAFGTGRDPFKSALKPETASEKTMNIPAHELLQELDARGAFDSADITHVFVDSRGQERKVKMIRV